MDPVCSSEAKKKKAISEGKTGSTEKRWILPRGLIVDMVALVLN